MVGAGNGSFHGAARPEELYPGLNLKLSEPIAALSGAELWGLQG